MSIVKPKQAETVMQAAGLKAIVGPAVNLSLFGGLYFRAEGPSSLLRMPPGPTVQHLLGRPLRSPAGRWMETCGWVRAPAQDETQTKLGNSYDLSRVLADIVLTFGHQVYPESPIGLVSQYAKIVVQMKFMLQKSVPAEQLGGDHMSLMEACQTAEDFPLTGPPRPARHTDPAFEHKAGIQQAPQGLRLCPPVPAGSTSLDAGVVSEVVAPNTKAISCPGRIYSRTASWGDGPRHGLGLPKAARGSVAAVSPPPHPSCDVSRTSWHSQEGRRAGVPEP